MTFAYLPGYLQYPVMRQARQRGVQLEPPSTHLFLRGGLRSTFSHSKVASAAWPFAARGRARGGGIPPAARAGPGDLLAREPGGVRVSHQPSPKGRSRRAHKLAMRRGGGGAGREEEADVLRKGRWTERPRSLEEPASLRARSKTRRWGKAGGDLPRGIPSPVLPFRRSCLSSRAALQERVATNWPPALVPRT